ncbi:MAG: hypothetical protein JST70_12605 [Bacteroidetes bacterium]|nr:hypothetical protein [Bacteroidota bacterium]
MKKIAVLLSFLLVAACQKDHTVNITSGIRVRYANDSDYIAIQRVNAEWDYNRGVATILADGYKGESFLLNLTGIHDTCTIAKPGIETIDYSDGTGAIPDVVKDGYIHISHLSEHSIRGEFRFSSSSNGAHIRLVVGGFNIQNPRSSN